MSTSEASWESTLSLLARAHAGDHQALDDLFSHYGPRLRRWAGGRLPRWARDLSDTNDLVQETLLRTFKNIEGFEHRGEGAFQAYLRQALMNRIRDELKRAQRRPVAVEPEEDLRDNGVSPLEAVVGAEKLARYDAALERLRPEERELVVARVELGLSYAEVASACGKPSPDAARMAVTRALLRLAEEMRGTPGSSD